jgi:two-component system, LuxR family, sensor kinase FixL
MAISRLADGRMMEVNDRWLAMFGHRREEVIGRTVAEFNFYANEQDREHIVALAERGNVSDVEIAFRYRTGNLLQTILSTEIVDIEGQPCLITIIRDITERRRTEMEMTQQRSELAHLSRVAMLGELSGSLAHELNQPLSAILANAQAAQRFLARKPANFDEIDDILKDIVADDKRAGEVIRRLRVLFKKEEMQHQSVDVNEVVQEVMQLMRSELMNRRVSVITRLAPDLPRVKGDRVHLQQVLVNLIMNGADAMEGIEHERRSLTMQTRLVDASAVAMSVIDQGKGIPVVDIERIFDPFVTTKPHGMGLGLAVSRTIMQAHGGRLWAANNPDRGATFCLTLPLSNL